MGNQESVVHLEEHEIVNLADQDPNLTRSSYKDNQFSNPWKGWEERTFSELIKWQREHPTPRPPATAELDKLFPVIPLDPGILLNPPEDKIQAIWIGHATFLVQMNGITFLTDPIFCERASPVQFAGPARLRPTPIELENIPKIDFVIVSHNHYDHLDREVVEKLKNTTWIVPKLMKKWFKELTECNVVELDWWDLYKFSPQIEVIYTPCQHWSKRTLNDTRETLWGSFIVRSGEKSVYFSGDTGYCDIFKEVGTKLGPFDLALIPIGAYEPNWFLKPQHVNPEEAVMMHKDIRSKKSIGMHWGTFVLSNEEYFQPREDLIAATQSLPEDEFITVNIGEIIQI